MNLLVKKLWPSVIIILAAVVVISCEDPGRIGLIINKENGLLKTGFKEIPLPTSVVQFDPRKTAGSSTFQAGSFSDQEFGDVDYKYYTEMIPAILVEPSENARFDKFTMSIGFTDMTGPIPQNRQLNYLAINQLAEPIDSTVNYIRTDELSLKTQLGEWVFEPYYDDTLRTDTTYIIDLDSDVGLDLFTKLKEGDEIFENADKFNAYFNGISVETGTAATHIFKLDPTKILFTIHYIEVNSDGNPVEREYTLSVGGENFHHISADYSATPLSGITADNTDFFPSNDLRYMQSGTMLAIKVDLSPFRILADTIEHMIINKAEVVLENVRYGSEFNQPPNDVLAYFTNQSNEWPIIDYVGRVDSSKIGEQFVALQDQSLDIPAGFYGFNEKTDYLADSLSYTVNMSAFLQKLYAGDFSSTTDPFVEEHGLVFLFTETSVLFPSFSAAHTATNGMKVHKDNIKLRIYYSYPSIQQTE